MEKNNQFYLIKTINEIDTILEYSKDVKIETLIEKPVILDGIVFRMIQMSEHMNNITQEFKLAHPNIDWISIKGFRNRLVHNYGGVDLKFVYNAINEDIPNLKKELLELIS
ncbi:MAG: DUF86 domain-containing protein [Acholeplasmatales bacterium]|nr:DUF86 domain-containing protein [Acholeplasmatales bacterium]MBQ6783202.1 DUF86 domain-containing protein [Acholeplasmatales bacterium]